MHIAEPKKRNHDFQLNRICHLFPVGVYFVLGVFQEKHEVTEHFHYRGQLLLLRLLGLALFVVDHHQLVC